MVSTGPEDPAVVVAALRRHLDALQVGGLTALDAIGEPNSMQHAVLTLREWFLSCEEAPGRAAGGGLCSCHERVWVMEGGPGRWAYGPGHPLPLTLPRCKAWLPPPPSPSRTGPNQRAQRHGGGAEGAQEQGQHPA
jgi:hypothetical protein